ncbi:MAG: pectate lyase [Deltaproteobacteria bacterium]|nr:pectate lyase [Deltaproteobacteria bacterium]
MYVLKKWWLADEDTSDERNAPAPMPVFMTLFLRPGLLYFRLDFDMRFQRVYGVEHPVVVALLVKIPILRLYIDNITWEDVGEDAASVRSYFPGGAIIITNSRGYKAADKMFQFNAPCKVRIERFEGSQMGKLVRQNGDTDFELYIDLNTVFVTEVISAVVQSDSPDCFVRYHALSYQFTGSGDKSERVFRDIPAANVTAY